MQQSSPEHAFETLYKKYQEPITRYLETTWVHDKELAADLCQDTFVLLLVGLSRRDTTLKTDYHVKNWLYNTARHRAIDYARRHKLIAFESLPEGEVHTQYTELMVGGYENQTHDRLLLQDAIAQIPLKQWELLQLKLDGYTDKKIGAKKGIAEGTVSAYISLARKELRKKYYQVPVDIRIMETKAAFRQSGMIFISLECTLPQETKKPEYRVYHESGNPFYLRETVGILQMDDDKFRRVIFEENKVDWMFVNSHIKDPSLNKMPHMPPPL